MKLLLLLSSIRNTRLLRLGPANCKEELWLAVPIRWNITYYTLICNSRTSYSPVHLSWQYTSKEKRHFEANRHLWARKVQWICAVWCAPAAKWNCKYHFYNLQTPGGSTHHVSSCLKKIKNKITIMIMMVIIIFIIVIVLLLLLLASFSISDTSMQNETTMIDCFSRTWLTSVPRSVRIKITQGQSGHMSFVLRSPPICPSVTSSLVSEDRGPVVQSLQEDFDKYKHRLFFFEPTYECMFAGGSSSLCSFLIWNVLY